MTASRSGSGPRLALALLLSTVAAPPVAAQMGTASTAAPATAFQQAPAPAALDADPAEALGRYLRVLSTNPIHLESLTGAGRAALAVGDPSAAIGFFARAEELAPRNGRIKAGLASALVQLEQPRPALRLFDDATDLGVPEAEIAGDRGLAYDLRGDTRRAQADYRLALRTVTDPEVERRLALSMAIAGDGPGALAVLDPQLRAQDRAAWRTRAFVLAVTGDKAGAAAAAEQALPAGQGAAMAPFLARIGGLRASQKAQAVHFGRLPSDARPTPVATLLADMRAAASRLIATTPKPAAEEGAGASVAASTGGPVTGAKGAAVTARADRATPPAAGVAVPGKPKAAAAASKSAKVAAKSEPKPDPKPAKAEPKTPERYWVQLASGANKGDLGKVWSKQRSAQPKLLSGRNAWTSPWRASHRLLTGPFDDEDAAQAFVNTLGKAGVSAIQFTTRAGVEVERIATK